MTPSISYNNHQTAYTMWHNSVINFVKYSVISSVKITYIIIFPWPTMDAICCTVHSKTDV